MLLLSLIAVAHAGVSATDMADAMDIDATDVLSSTVTGDASAYDVFTDSGTITPTSGVNFAYLSTGDARSSSRQPGTDFAPTGSPSGDTTELDLTLTVPKDAHSFGFDFYFLSAEYPEFVGSPYNDGFEANITGSAWSGNAAIDSKGHKISINSALFTVTKSADLTGTGFDKGVGGGTGWLTVIVPADPGDTIELVLQVADASDGIYDSAVVLDNFYWSDSIVTTPVIVKDIVLDFLSPKRGPVDGSTKTDIIGSGFGVDCSASFDGIVAPTTFVDSGTLEVTPPPHAVGLVDVDVSCVGVSATLKAGYTYYDTTSGDVPPTLVSVDPHQVDVDGGDLVDVTGTGFATGATLQVDGSSVDCTVLDDAHLEFQAPAHAEGSVDVAVRNVDGLSANLPGALLYVDRPVWPPIDTGGDTGTGVTTDGKTKEVGACDASGGLQSLWLAALAFAALRRRR